MKRLTQAQSELIDAFLAEHSSRVSTAQLENDLLISDLFPVFAQRSHIEVMRRPSFSVAAQQFPKRTATRSESPRMLICGSSCPRG
jgi:hypothetical protein